MSKFILPSLTRHEFHRDLKTGVCDANMPNGKGEHNTLNTKREMDVKERMPEIQYLPPNSLR